MSRHIVQGDAFAWLSANTADAGASVVTSLPDISEVPHLTFDAWRTWFMDAARRVIRWLPEHGVAIFYQSDIRVAGVWVDKGYLVMRAAEDEGADLLWHKIVCRRPAGTIALGRSSYSHMIGVGPAVTTAAPPNHRVRSAPRRPGPDVLPDAGRMTWTRGMGVEACRVACRYLKDETATRVVVDPFCGRGTVLAVANAMGLDAIGVELSAKRCRAARSLVIEPIRPDIELATAADSLRRGMSLFDAGAFFEAHEVWEERWRVETRVDVRTGLQGLIQVAAAFHKLLVVGSPDSAARLLAKGITKLEASPAIEGIDLDAFRKAARLCAEAIAAGRARAITPP